MPSKRKLKVELINDNDLNVDYDTGTDIFTELESSETNLDQSSKSAKTDGLDIIKIQDKTMDQPSSSSVDVIGCRDVILEANFDKLDQVIAKCVGLAEKCIADNTNQDSNEVFGKYMASLVRELPNEKRMKVRFEIIQFAGKLIANEMNNFK